MQSRHRSSSRLANTPSSAGAVIAIVIAMATASCGDGDDEPPTAVELSTMLMTAATFDDIVDDGPWNLNVPPDQPDAASGIVSEEMQELLPQMDLCPAASDEARAEAESLRWTAYRQLDLDVTDPIELPDDRSGHLVFVQEYLTADDEPDTDRTFELLSSGMQACLGDIAAGEEGPGTVTELATPSIGDERYGIMMVIGEAGGWAEWRIHQVLVREETVLALFSIVDIRADTAPLFSSDVLDEMFTRMADALDP